MGLGLGLALHYTLAGSIRRLAAQVRDAAGKMGDSPEIVLTEEGDFDGLHDQVDQLAHRIEGTVRELQQRQREVLRAEQMAAVGQLAAGVAHEVRNPLASIKLLVQAGQEEGALPVEDLRVIEGEVRRMEQGLQTLLDFARPPAPERRPTDLRDVVAHACGLVRGRAAKQGVTVHADLPASEARIVADRQQLEQVLINLALNALDAMPHGGNLKASVRVGPSGAILEVADTGPGLSPEARERLFKPFASGKPTGLGLGLVISRRIVEDHGGTITAANRPTGGAVFTIRLPHGL
jgi:signal transduction histidine kinase